MLTCKQVTALASEAYDRRLSLREKIGMRLHLLICALCRRYLRQLDFIHGIGARIAHDEGHLLPALSPQARARIHDHLGEHGHPEA